MRLWGQDNGLVNAVLRKNNLLIEAVERNPKTLNVLRDLYALKAKNGKRDTLLESEFYSKLDHAACELTREIISILESGNAPKLNQGARRQLWQFYLYNAYKRHPDIWKPYFDNLDIANFKNKLTAVLIDKGRSPKKAKNYTNNLRIDEAMKNNAVQMARAYQTDSVLQNLQNLGVIIGVAPAGNSFILPSLSFKVGKVEDNNQKGTWIPIHPKYAITPVGPNAQAMVLPLDKRDVRRLNEHWYIMSKTVISTSKKLLVSLARNVDRQKISFE